MFDKESPTISHLKKSLSQDNFIFTLIINGHREWDDLLLPSTRWDCTVREFCVPIGQDSYSLTAHADWLHTIWDSWFHGFKFRFLYHV